MLLLIRLLFLPECRIMNLTFCMVFYGIIYHKVFEREHFFEV